MAVPGSFPPPPEVIARLAALPGARLSPGAVFAVDGPAPAGPERAQAVLVLQATLAEPDGAGRFWAANGDLLAAAIRSPGFVRFIGFGDGLCSYAIVFWRSPEEAKAFAAGPAHRGAVTDLYRHPSQYTHFATLYSTGRVNPRTFFCDACGRASSAPANQCPGCGHRLIDVFDTYAQPQGVANVQPARAD
jgi:hypothetical protein